MRNFTAKPLGFTMLLLTGLFFLPNSAMALRYRPRAEETLSHLALMFYGDAKKHIYLSTANGIRDPDKFPRGKRLWIPTVWKYRVKRGDSLAKISAKYLKSTKRSDFLGWLNRIRDPKDLKVGKQIKIPFLLRHRVKSGESMVDVARRYYFQTKPTGLLRTFNGKRTNALKPGERVLVPIYDPEALSDRVKKRLKRHKERLAKAPPIRELAMQESSSSAKPDTANGTEDPGEEKPAPDDLDDPDGQNGTPSSPENRVTPPQDAAAVQSAFRLYRDGEYELARSNLSRVLEQDRLSEVDEAEAREILAFCLVAMDRPKEAEHEFVRLLMVAPDRTLDPVTTSPKILEVFNRAKGTR